MRQSCPASLPACPGRAKPKRKESTDRERLLSRERAEAASSLRSTVSLSGVRNSIPSAERVDRALGCECVCVLPAVDRAKIGFRDDRDPARPVWIVGVDAAAASTHAPQKALPLFGALLARRRSLSSNQPAGGKVLLLFFGTNATLAASAAARASRRSQRRQRGPSPSLAVAKESPLPQPPRPSALQCADRQTHTHTHTRDDDGGEVTPYS